MLKKLAETNMKSLLGYGMDCYTESAKEKIRKACGEALVFTKNNRPAHFMTSVKKSGPPGCKTSEMKKGQMKRSAEPLRQRRSI